MRFADEDSALRDQIFELLRNSRTSASEDLQALMQCTPLGICRLCGKTDELKESHIVPRFVYKWMRNTGGSYFRSSIDPQRHKQDGPKEHLLCGDCEQQFSSRESYFKQSIFDPYINNQATSFPYDERLFYFTLSVAWRVLVHDFNHKDIRDHAFIDRLREAEKEWREYLLTGSVPPTYQETHIFFTDISTNHRQPVRKINLYFTRAVDGTVASSASSCAVYWKFARFVSFSAITPFAQSLWDGTRVCPTGGTIVIPQQMKDGVLGEFMVDRARLAAEAATIPLTEKQEEFHDARIAHNPAEFLCSDLGKAITADATSEVDPHILYPKVGRNEPCPCGSGRNYKKCHSK